MLGYLSLVACVLLATGCASTGKSTVRQPFVAKLGQFESTVVEVTSTVATPPAKIDEFMTQLEVRIITKLREQRAFEKVYSWAANADAQAQLKVSVVITSVREVDNFDRLMWGAMAGQASTKAVVEIRETASDALLGSHEIVGKSSGGTVFAGTTNEAVDRTAEEVVRIIVENL